MAQLIDRTLRKLREHRFLRGCRAVLSTSPARVREDGVVIFSMIGTRVLLPYLVAAKSFQAQLGRGRFAILDDGTLTAADKEVLAHHLGNPPITPIASVDTGPCPRGGTWERLLTILDLRQGDYVIQIDSDVVALGPVGEVAAAQGKAAPGGEGRALAEAFSQEAERLLGADYWAEWGSEQVTSNFVVANEPEARLLPYDRYLNFWNEPVSEGAGLVHFIGTYRYHRGAYLAAARRAIAALR